MLTAHRSKVLLLIPHLGGGGAERVIALLARGLSPEKYDLHLGVVAATAADAEILPEWVHLHILGAARVRGAALPLLRLVRRLRPDLILSGMFHLNFLLLLLRPFLPRRTRILVRQNGTASAALNFGGLPWYTRLLYRLLYRRADRVLCQSEAMATDLARNFGVPAARLTVLLNPVEIAAIRNAAVHGLRLPEEPAPLLLAVGRLVREKGFDLLLEAFTSLRVEFPNARLLVAGSGPEAAALLDQAQQLELGSAVHFAGAVPCPWQLFPSASLFVLSSRHEGLPNALLEAAAGGLPIVALPSSEGVSDLLRNQPGVWLADEVSAEALANSLRQALRALQPGERFSHPFIDAFSMDRSMRAYEGLIDNVLSAALAQRKL